MICIGHVLIYTSRTHTKVRDMDKCDVLIVGGGPAGSSLAWALRNSKLNITIIDRNQFPRNKTCAGWITPTVIKLLDLNIEEYAKLNVIQAIHGFRISIIGNDNIEIHYPDEPASYGIRRCEFDDYLLKRGNANIKQGVSLNSIERESDGWLVNKTIHARLVIGAGGHFCPIARYMNQDIKRSVKKIVAQEAEIKFTEEELFNCLIDRCIPEIFFCSDLKGYGWIFQKGNYLNIGLGREDTKNLSQHVQEFCDYLIKQNKVPENISRKFNGHAYYLYQHSPRKIVDDAILLVGDAAGLAYNQSGEGICPAVESGLMAANVIEYVKGNYAENKLENYEYLIRHRYGKRHVNDNYLKLPIGFKKYMAHKLLKTKWFARHIVLDNWFLHANTQPLNISY